MVNSYFLRSRKLIKKYFEEYQKKHSKFVPGKSKIPIADPPYGWEEVCESLESLLMKETTLGVKVKKFEELFARYIGTKYAIMVNSGSSANLLALSILTNPSLGQDRIKVGDEIITPAVTWSTTVFPLTNVGVKPVFVDVKLGTYDIDSDQIESAITSRTKAIMPVHLLGYPCNMKKIKQIAQKHGLLIIEDSCEAHGAEYFGQKVGSFGDVATFSFFASHHITTMEGGMLVTNHKKFYELAKSIRAHGWIRDLQNKSIAKKYLDIDPRFLFINIGYNIRPTEIQGSFGIHQIKKLDYFIKIRSDNSNYFKKRLLKYSDFLILPIEEKGYKNSCFAFPISVRKNKYFTRNELISYLKNKKIETRPLMAGNMVQQPVMKYLQYRVNGKIQNSKFIMKNSFLVANHQGINRIRREYIADTIIRFIEKKINKKKINN